MVVTGQEMVRKQIPQSQGFHVESGKVKSLRAVREK